MTAQTPPTPPATRFFKADVLPFTSSARACLSTAGASSEALLDDDVDDIDGAGERIFGSGEAGVPLVVAV